MKCMAALCGWVGDLCGVPRYVIDKMTLYEMTIDKMTLDRTTFDNMILYKIAINK